ncbi:hypothetical protein CYMTET_56837 [Cymbomonas tetramitiformis]|uniref:Uncharacterized protein n=1 Tax=Cymbomonas tetramitiformis TaxID=36881 RepID=A0AAE0ELK3_9CHLO|nr:hypothetical protein CYMTET_56837 [Cymbomonas tetramitiformis]
MSSKKFTTIHLQIPKTKSFSNWGSRGIEQKAEGREGASADVSSLSNRGSHGIEQEAEGREGASTDASSLKNWGSRIELQAGFGTLSTTVHAQLLQVVGSVAAAAAQGCDAVRTSAAASGYGGVATMGEL